MKKKWGFLAVAVMSAVLLSGCSSSGQGINGAPATGQENSENGNQGTGDVEKANTGGQDQGTEKAEEWPSKTITWYGASAGGTVDVNFRALAKVLEPHLGVSIVIINDNNIINQDSMLRDKAVCFHAAAGFI